MNFKNYFFIAVAFTIGTTAIAQEVVKDKMSIMTPGQELLNKKNGKYKFTVVKNMEATEVLNQNQSGTCWTFSSLSFLESELLRMGKPKSILSEMFIVRNAYADKADKYVRMHGEVNFAGGGAFHDVTYVLKNYGMLPREAYTGLANGEKEINHNELDAVVKGMMDAVIKVNKLTPAWKKSLNATLDAYLGPVPQTFTYQGKSYTPKSYSESLGLNINDYVEIGSFTHHPFYSKFMLEVPDNWMSDEIYNVPLDEMMDIIDNALINGYTIAWGADVSEKGFSFKNGVAIVPELDWDDVKKEEIDSVILNPGKQKVITQAMRQEAFDNYETQDDHGMHITGIAKDQNGTKYYIVKNSWGTKRNDCDGYFYASEAYVKYKTMDFMVHKSALKKEVAKKLGI